MAIEHHYKSFEVLFLSDNSRASTEIEEMLKGQGIPFLKDNEELGLNAPTERPEVVSLSLGEFVGIEGTMNFIDIRNRHKEKKRRTIKK